MKKSAFTLVEILVTLGVVAILAAILWPVFQSARSKARETSCQSNLKQIGLAFSLYAQDYDSRFPLGGDPVDLNTNLWEFEEGGQYQFAASKLKPLPIVVGSYLKNHQVWVCPSDSGFKQLDRPSGFLPNTFPSAASLFGMSYLYRTELGLKNKSVSGIVAYDDFVPYDTYGPDRINVLFDMYNGWHGDHQSQGRYNVLFADGHVKSCSTEQYNALWMLSLKVPTS